MQTRGSLGRVAARRLILILAGTPVLSGCVPTDMCNTCDRCVGGSSPTPLSPSWTCSTCHDDAGSESLALPEQPADGMPMPEHVVGESPVEAVTFEVADPVLAEVVPAEPGARATLAAPEPVARHDAPPVPGGLSPAMERHMRRLETDLLRRHRRHPHLGRITASVRLMPMGGPEQDISGRRTRLRVAQVVTDRWGRRLPDLEDKTYVLVFGPPGAEGSERAAPPPSVTAGLDSTGLTGTYGEHESITGTGRP